MRELLEEALAEARVVSIDREGFEEVGELGYVVAVGESLFVLLQVSDAMRFNGFSVLRTSDVSDIEIPHAHADFVESALRLRDESVAEPPPIDLASMKTAIRSAGRVGEIVTLHTETTEPGLCKIGRIRTVDDAVASLVALDPDAEWDDEVTTVAVDEVTRVDVGGAYEEALLLVGGPCPVPILRPVD
ncbi:MAG: hypothetical protein AAGC67_21315 [Myxococcota bacterium]